MKPKKRSTFFTIFRILGLFLMGLAVALVVALSQVNLETLRGNILAILRNATGLPVEIDGAVSWKLSLRPRIELNQVRVPNAEWARHKYAFSAEKIDVTINLLSLLRDRPTIQNVKIYDATACLEKNAAGEFSVKPFADVKDADENAVDASGRGVQPKYPFVDPGLGGVEVRNAVLHILDDTYSVAGFSIRYVPRRESREYAGWIRSKSQVFPFIVSYSQYNAERKVYPVRVAFSTGGDALIADVALEGTSRLPIDFLVRGDIPDIAAFGEAVGLDWMELPRISVNAAGGFDGRKITLRKSSFAMRGNEINLTGEWELGRRTSPINLNVDSRRISLQELMPWMYGRKWVRPDRELNVFHDIPLFGAQIRDWNLNLRVDIGEFIVYRDLTIRDLDLKLRLRDAQARIDARAGIGGGGIRAAADVDIETDGTMDARAAAVGENIVVGRILDEIRVRDIISELPVNFQAFVVGRGSNLSEMMQTITGPVQIYSVGSGYAHSALVSNMYGTDFLTSLRHSIQDLFRSEKKHNQIKISCAALNTKLRAGLAETQHGVAVETNAINLRLAGSLDLGGETMKLSLTTVPVRGLKLSLTGNVMNSVEITGNLAEPDIKINGAAVVGKVASATGLGLLLAPLTGGISIVAGAGVGLIAGDLLENWLADDTPCKTAMNRGAPSMREDPQWMDAPIGELVGELFENN